MMASSVGEVVACSVRVPVEVVKQRAQANAGGGSSIAAVRYVVSLGKDRGFWGVWREIYRGWGVTIMREIPFTVIQFPLWEWLKKKTVRARSGSLVVGGKERKASGMESALCGSVAGAVAAGLTTPLDVLKTRMMLAEKV